jgi:serine/threonine protein kinase
MNAPVPADAPSDGESSSIVEALLIDALDAAESAGPAALETICARHPEHAAVLRKRWAELARMGLLEQAPGLDMPERLGEFRILRRLGGGGMGVVYLAVQEPLGREVALKLVRPDQLFLPGLRERFLREVQIVARLQHPGIVPIYTFGKANGVPYFAMEHVHGATFEQLLNELAKTAPAQLSGAALGAALLRVLERDGGQREALDEWLYSGTWEEVCLRIVRLVADALAHVHARGAQHRDVKPSNVMLTPSGRVMLLDFGLAQGAGTDRLTRTATQLGSIPYMPPEQLRSGGDAAGDSDAPRADIYSLGVTLYQALCLRLPYDAGSTTATLLAITQGSPAAPRKLNPALSWEAETVCLSAMDPEAARRYARADDFARDIGNVLEKRPIEARRVGSLRRVQRWAQRRPAQAVAIALTLLIALGGPSAWLWQEHQNVLALGLESARAKRNLQSALSAVDRLFSRVSEAELSRIPHMESFRRTLLEDALSFQQGLLVDNAGDPELRAQQALTHGRVGRLQLELGRYEEAQRSIEAGLESLAPPSALVLRERPSVAPAEPAVAATDASAASAGSGVVLAAERSSDAVTDPLLGLDLAVEPLRVLARLRYDQAQVALQRGLLDVADRAAQSAVAVAAHLLAANPLGYAPLLTQIESTTVRGRVATLQGRLGDAAAQFQDALKLIERGNIPGMPEDLFALAAVGVGNEYGALLTGEGAEGFGDHAAAEQVLQRTISRFEADLREDAPAQQYALCCLRTSLASVLVYLAKTEEAAAQLDVNEPVLTQLVERFPLNVSYRESLAKLYNNRAQLAVALDRRTSVRGDLQKAVDTLRDLIEAVPGSAESLSSLAVSENNLATIDLSLQQFEDAAVLLEAAVEHGTAALALAPDNVIYADRLSQHWFWLYDARRDLGDVDGAIEAMRNHAKLTRDDWHPFWEVASRMSELARKLPSAAPDRGARIEQLGEVAAQHLRVARDRGCDEWPELLENPKLAPLAQTRALLELAADPAR